MIKKIITYLILFISALFLYRTFLYTGIRKNKQGIYNKYNELFIKKGNSYDVLFLGSSRAEMHFHPKIFDSITGLNSYNMGISGASVRISYAMLKTYCSQHNKPKFVIYNVDYFHLKNDTDRINDFPIYFPYLSNTNLRRELNNIDHRFTSFYYNPLHSIPYTQIESLSPSLHGWLNILGKYDTLMYKGFQTCITNELQKKETNNPIYSYISIKNRNYIDSLITYTKTNNIQLILVTTPVVGEGNEDVLNKSILVQQMHNIASINHISYINYTDSLNYRDTLLFADHFHLNLIGALKFSKKFSLTFDTILVKKALFNK